MYCSPDRFRRDVRPFALDVFSMVVISELSKGREVNRGPFLRKGIQGVFRAEQSAHLALHDRNLADLGIAMRAGAWYHGSYWSDGQQAVQEVPPGTAKVSLRPFMQQKVYGVNSPCWRAYGDIPPFRWAAS